ncbi:bacillithiol system redox-active protein YtxJ [Jeotgalibacillus proteolyticus]|uniref:Bacillithiol system redox-active protein YtxJ n=1 Tax=Jeotgalibacillus proteolyticus TaxID=2082395 RepID=A0A2S5GFA9_9BACL|nr:bacillithiol system redox-active protein YtxJ [Jeotgalibacillus proteolyticus]PPA71669.1 bacillithiol system redox-active protein YtxJ [Jeotgalibacillus proteolyticus]
MKKIDQITEFDEAISANKPFFLLKHSLTCPISASAYEEFKRFSENADSDTYYLAVQKARELSAHIAATYGVKHESPQVLYFKDGQPVWNASHYKIKEQALKEQLSN